MKNLSSIFFTLLLLSACGTGGGSDAPKGNAELSTENDSIFYALGASFSQSSARSQLSLNPSQFEKGFKDAEQGESYLNRDNMQTVSGSLQRKARAIKDGSPPQELIDSLSYTFGGIYYYQFDDLGMEINQTVLFTGVHDYADAAEGATGKLTDEQIREMMIRFNPIAQEAQAKKNAELAAGNKQKGNEFLAQKKAEPDVQSTPSGLLYKVLQKGSGASPQATDKVKVHYEGRLMDGTVFDSSIQRGQPAEFFLNRVIKGWTEGVQLMQTGSKYQFYIPADLAYGNMGSPPKIGPGETLIFDVELLEIVK